MPMFVKIKTTTGKKFRVQRLGNDYFGTYGGNVVTCPLYNFQALKWLVHEIKHQISKGWDCVILMTGPERSGKSTLALHLALALDKTFNLDKLHFEVDPFTQCLRFSKPGDVVISDEAGSILYYLEWYEQVQKKLVKAFQLIGKRGICTILVLPHRTLLNAQLRERRVTYWIHVVSRKWTRGYARVRIGRQNEWKRESFWEGLFTMTFPALTGELWDSYEKKKDSFITKFLSGETLTKREARYKKLYLGILRRVKKRYKLSQDQLGKLCGISQQKISRLLSGESEEEIAPDRAESPSPNTPTVLEVSDRKMRAFKPRLKTSSCQKTDSSLIKGVE